MLLEVFGGVGKPATSHQHFLLHRLVRPTSPFSSLVLLHPNVVAGTDCSCELGLQEAFGEPEPAEVQLGPGRDPLCLRHAPGGLPCVGVYDVAHHSVYSGPAPRRCRGVQMSLP